MLYYYYIYGYTGVLHPREWMFRRPLLLKVLVNKKSLKTKLSEKEKKTNLRSIANSQGPVRLRSIQKIPTPTKCLISSFPETINHIYKKYSLEKS